MMSAWAPLYRALRDNLRGPRYHRGMECIDVRSDAGSATARFADGSEARGDLLIAAEGLRSTVRARLLPELQPAYAGYVTWRALMPESKAVRAARDILERDYLFCVPEGSLALCYAVPARDGDLRVGHRDYNCAWYRPVDGAELAELCTDTSGKCHGTSIPPPLLRPDVVAWSKAQAWALVAPQVSEIFERDDSIAIMERLGQRFRDGLEAQANAGRLSLGSDTSPPPRSGAGAAAPRRADPAGPGPGAPAGERDRESVEDFRVRRRRGERDDRIGPERRTRHVPLEATQILHGAFGVFIARSTCLVVSYSGLQIVGYVIDDAAQRDCAGQPQKQAAQEILLFRLALPRRGRRRYCAAQEFKGLIEVNIGKLPVLVTK
jgi:hypothetical protein